MSGVCEVVTTVNIEGDGGGDVGWSDCGDQCEESQQTALIVSIHTTAQLSNDSLYTSGRLQIQTSQLKPSCFITFLFQNSSLFLVYIPCKILEVGLFISILNIASQAPYEEINDQNRKENQRKVHIRD